MSRNVAVSVFRRPARSLQTAAVLCYPRVRPNARAITKIDSSNEATEPVPAEAQPSNPVQGKVVPWYVEYGAKYDDEFPVQRKELAALPVIPEDAPALLTKLAEYTSQELGLKDLSLLDLRNRETPWGMETMMLLATAGSERQLRGAADSLKGYLRPQGINPRVEGLINWQSTKVKRKRRRKMLGRANYQVEDDALTWLFVDIGQSGLILQLFTEKGRSEYRLEELWAKKANNDVDIPEVTAKPARPFQSVLESFQSGSGALSRRMYSTGRMSRVP